MKHTLLAILLGLTAVGLVIFSLSPASRADDNGVSLSFSADDNGQVITTGQTIHFTAVLTNTDAVSRAFIFAASVPTGTVFVAASSDLQPNTYPVGATVADQIKSLTWNGAIAAGQTTAFTFTLQVESSGPLPGGDIPTIVVVFEEATGQEIARQTITLDWPGVAVYLPVIFRQAAVSPTPTPPPLPSPTPTATPVAALRQITPTIAGILQSQAETYIGAMSGTDASGNDVLSSVSPDHYWGLTLPLSQCRSEELSYRIARNYFEFDTTGATGFNGGYLVFRHDMAFPGPPAHAVNIYQGTWTQLLTGTIQVQPENWAAYGDLIAAVPGHTAPLPVITSTVMIPAAYINPGGITKLAFASSTEGTPPASYSCFGGPPPLGGSTGLPYLYLVPDSWGVADSRP